MNNFKDTPLDPIIQRLVRKTMDRDAYTEMMEFIVELLKDGEDRNDIIIYLENELLQLDDSVGRRFKKKEHYKESVKICKQYQ